MGAKKSIEINKNDINQDLIKAARIGHVKLVKLLLENGADVHAENDYALRRAAEKGHVEVVKLLESYSKIKQTLTKEASHGS